MNDRMYCLITTTFDDEGIAQKVMKILLEERLISCAQIIKIRSSYHWKNKLESTDELLLQMKSKKSLYKEIENRILQLHNYEIPQIVMYDIVDGYKEYLDWIEEETK
jgi:periplasmic divalent cation tolerance protein